MVDEALRDDFMRYFGVGDQNGVNLLGSCDALPLEKMELLRQAIADRAEGARVFFMGNGGSFDNARIIAQMCRRLGIAATTPGEADDYPLTTKREGYEMIFVRGLEQDRLSSDDIIVGISGSGNSPNVVKALELARERGAAAFCLGGRDGGAMRPVCGDEHAIIVKNACMEAIEDLHFFVMVCILDAIETGFDIARTKSGVMTRLHGFADTDNCISLAMLAEAMITTMHTGGRVFVLGTGIGSNHFRADMGRGATNTIPIRGLSTPEMYTVNSGQATANDDGSDFVLVDGLVKHDPNQRDLAVITHDWYDQPINDHCREVLRAAGTQVLSFGPERGTVDIGSFRLEELEGIVSMIGHACGEVIRTWLQRRYEVRPLDIEVDIPPGQRKLGMSATQDLEKDLRAKGELAEDEVVTYCYGCCFAVRMPEEPAGERCYY